MQACESYGDWYRLDEEAPFQLRIWRPDGLPALELQLFNSNDPNLPIQRALSGPGGAWVAAEAGEYLLSVQAVEGGSGPYSISSERGIICAEDSYERPWRNDHPEAAQRIGLGSLEARLCPGDQDWFLYEGEAPARISLEGDVELELEGQPFSELIEGATRLGISGEGVYRLSLNPERAADARCQEAPPLLLGEPVEISALEGADDFAPACRFSDGPEQLFLLELEEPGTLNLRLMGEDRRGGLLLYEDCNAEPLSCGVMSELSAELESGRWYVVVDGPYEGQLLAELQPASLICETPLPLNPGETQLIELPEGSSNHQGICVLSEEPAAVYRFEVSEPSNALIRLEGAGEDALLSLREECEAAEILSCRAGEGAQIETSLETGPYWIFAQGNGSLSLNLELEPLESALQFQERCTEEGMLLDSGARYELEGNNGVARDDFDASRCGARNGGGDLLLPFRLNEATRLSLNLSAPNFHAVLALLEGGCEAEPLCAEIGESQLVAELPAGFHALLIDGADFGEGGRFSLTLQLE